MLLLFRNIPVKHRCLPSNQPRCNISCLIHCSFSSGFTPWHHITSCFLFPCYSSDLILGLCPACQGLSSCSWTTDPTLASAQRQISAQEQNTARTLFKTHFADWPSCDVIFFYLSSFWFVHALCHLLSSSAPLVFSLSPLCVRCGPFVACILLLKTSHQPWGAKYNKAVIYMVCCALCTWWEVGDNGRHLFPVSLQ